MNFSSFDYFLALARERSYTRAADVLHITQQSLSAAIAALERELGCPLVVRRMPDTMAYPISFGYAKRATHGACWRTSSASPARSIRSALEGVRRTPSSKARGPV